MFMCYSLDDFVTVTWSHVRVSMNPIETQKHTFSHYSEHSLGAGVSTHARRGRQFYITHNIIIEILDMIIIM